MGGTEAKQPKNEILYTVVTGHRLLPMIKFSGEIYVPARKETYAGGLPHVKDIVNIYHDDMKELIRLLSKYGTPPVFIKLTKDDK
jgi:hypothetical protein